MNLTQLIYLSRSVHPMTPPELNAIQSSALRNNPGRGLTGALLYVGGNFLQLLEGDENQVTSLYSTIQEDTRHKECRILSKTIQKVRLFPDWSMNVINVEKWGKEERGEFVALILDAETPGRLQLDRLVRFFESLKSKAKLNPV